MYSPLAYSRTLHAGSKIWHESSKHNTLKFAFFFRAFSRRIENIYKTTRPSHRARRPELSFPLLFCTLREFARGARAPKSETFPNSARENDISASEPSAAAVCGEEVPWSPTSSAATKNLPKDLTPTFPKSIGCPTGGTPSKKILFLEGPHFSAFFQSFFLNKN